MHMGGMLSLLYFISMQTQCRPWSQNAPNPPCIAVTLYRTQCIIEEITVCAAAATGTMLRLGKALCSRCVNVVVFVCVCLYVSLSQLCICVCVCLRVSICACGTGGGRQGKTERCSAVGQRFWALVISPEDSEQVKASKGGREGGRRLE